MSMLSEPHCPQCGDKEPWGVEVRAIYDGVLFWDCPTCHHH